MTIAKRTLSAEAKKKKPSNRGPIGWASLAVFMLTGGGIVAYVRYEKEEKRKGLVNFNVFAQSFKI